MSLLPLPLLPMGPVFQVSSGRWDPGYTRSGAQEFTVQGQTPEEADHLHTATRALGHQQ